jgi:hypothetical protein
LREQQAAAPAALEADAAGPDEAEAR